MAKKKKSKSAKGDRRLGSAASDAGQTKRPEEKGATFVSNPFVLHTFFIVIFIIVGFGLYSNTFNSPFVLDDTRIILENPTIRLTELSAESIKNGAIGYSANRPVSTLTFALNYYFNRYDSSGYHLVNIIFHILNAIILFFFLKLTFKIAHQRKISGSDFGPMARLWISFFAALLWLVHPVQIQSVTYIVQRMNSMGATFFMLALLCYARGRVVHLSIRPATAEQDGGARPYLWYAAGAASGLLALGSKESTAILPFFICLYEWYFFQDLSKKWLKSFLKYLVACIILFLLVAFVFLGSDPLAKFSALHDFSNAEFTWTQRVLTQARVVIHYISILFLPHPARLNFDYDFPLSYSLINPVTTLLSILVIVGLIAASFYLAKKERLISICILWFLGNLAIESSVIPLAIIFEHRTYLPSMLLFLIPITLGYRYLKPGALKIGLIAACVVILAVWTYQRNSLWENRVTLWTDVVQKSPDKARPHFNLGTALSEQQKDAEAIPHYQRALEINPRMAQPHINLGQIMEKQNRLKEAAAHYRAALENKPDFPDAYNNLGAILAKQGQTEKAIQFYQKALAIRPHFAAAHFGLANAFARKSDIEQAIRHYYLALQFKPEYAEAHINLGSIFLNSGENEKAIKHYFAALQIDPKQVQAYNNLGIALMQEGRIEAAISQFQKALQLKPDFTMAENNLRRALAIQKEIETEISRLQDILVNNPDNAEVHFQLGNLYFRKGDRGRAIQQYKKALQLDPKYLPALNNLALATAANREYYKALTVFLDMLNYIPDDADTHYNIACMYSRLNRVDEAVEWLKKALDKGYVNWESIKKDGDLDNIRGTVAYKNLIKHYEIERK